MSDRRQRPAKPPEELQRIYGELAPQFARFEPVDRLVLGPHRRALFSRARGRVLDVACGTGVNFPYLPPGVDLVGVDLSDEMVARAREAAADLDLRVAVHQADAADLAFEDGRFDTVVSSLSTCTFPDPVAVLREMGRVCAPDGRLLLLEHGRSRIGPIARFQEWLAPRHFERHGCRWTQRPARLVAEAGLEAVEVERSLLGVLTSMVVRPSS